MVCALITEYCNFYDFIFIGIDLGSTLVYKGAEFYFFKACMPEARKVDILYIT